MVIAYTFVENSTAFFLFKLFNTKYNITIEWKKWKLTFITNITYNISKNFWIRIRENIANYNIEWSLT